MSARPVASDTTSIYWRWRAPLRAGRLEFLTEADPLTVLSAGAGQEVWAINAAAGKNVDDIPVQAMPLISISTASFLGVEVADDPEIFKMLGNQIVGSLNPWRDAMARRCGDCAPPAMPFPAPGEAMSTGVGALKARDTTGVSIGVERHRRTVVPMLNRPTPMQALVIRLREGGAPTAAEWATPGLAGMAALELSARGDKRWIPTLLQAAQTGPSGTDQIAALWAARNLGGQHPLIARVEAAL